MTVTPRTEGVLRDAITAERGALCEVLSDLRSDEWDEPSLCEGWRVRDVVAHMTMPFRYSRAKFIRELSRDWGNFN